MKVIIGVIRAMCRYYFRVGVVWLLVDYTLTAAFALLLRQLGKRHISRSKRILADIFFFYMITVLTSTVLSRSSGTTASYKLDLFWSFRDILAGKGDSWLTTIENIVLFLPFGLLLPELLPGRGRALATVLLGFAFSLMIEGAQLVLKKGLFELDDIVTNTIGVVLGWLVYVAVARGVRLWRRRRPGKAE